MGMNTQTQEALKLALEALEVATTPLAKDRQEVLRAITAIREALADHIGDANKMVEQSTCKQALQVEQPAQQQEPFCYHDGRDIVGKEYADHSDVFPLYTAPKPRQWVGLTQQDMKLALKTLEKMGRVMKQSPDTEKAIVAIRKALAEQPAQQQEIDWKDQYEKQKRRAEMWIAKYEADIGPLEKAGPVTAQQQEPVALDVTIEGDSAKLLAAMLEPVLDEEPIPIRLLVGNGHSGHGLYVAAAEYQDEGAALLVNTSPPASKPWVGLTEKEHTEIAVQCGCMSADWVFYGATVERILKEKNS